MSQGSRSSLFAALAMALIAAALLLGAGARPSTTPAQVQASPEATRPTPDRAARPLIARSARRFLGSFLHYEASSPAPAIIRSLRGTATPGFATELINAPPGRSSRGRRSNPALGRLSIAVVSTDPPLASVTAVARRPSGPEQLSFVFVRRHGRWLASAPGE